jgi:ankyrin repeat protein
VASVLAKAGRESAVDLAEALLNAAMYGLPASAQQLLKHGAKFNPLAAGANHGGTPLMMACIAGRHGVAALLLADKQYVESDTLFSEHVVGLLEMSVLQGFALTVELLVLHIGKSRSVSGEFDRALRIAATVRRPEICRVLLNAGANANSVGALGVGSANDTVISITPLVAAAKAVDLETVNLLLEHDAAVDQRTEDWLQATPLYHAATRGARRGCACAH